ncbi:hypothetical protein GGR55DRAFT_689325 [Xylaria sp. FL0064]|nr:hypothetical protein GGR55DRAFT_689325 [Xylaria sp. FL0064]
MENSEPLDACLICSKPNALRCSRCKSVRYCSKSCQRADFATHKLLCASFAGFDMTKRPTSEQMRAILFPPDEKKPKPVWIECKWDEGIQYRVAKPFLDENGISTPIEYNPILERGVSNAVYVAYRDSFLYDGSATNDSIATVTATNPTEHHDWRGPIIAYAKVGMDPRSATRCRDIDLNDFRHVADYFISYGATTVPTLWSQQSITFKGVKINCEGDQKLLNKPHFEEVELYSFETIVADYETSGIAALVGLPIMTKRYPLDPSWANSTQGSMNVDATYLHLRCDPQVKSDISGGILSWGSVPMRWQNNVGSVIIMRRDGKPLSRWHLEALCKYCRYEVSTLMTHVRGENSEREPMSIDTVLSMICPSSFSDF